MMRRSFRFSQYRIECNYFSADLADSAAADRTLPPHRADLRAARRQDGDRPGAYQDRARGLGILRGKRPTDFRRQPWRSGRRHHLGSATSGRGCREVSLRDQQPIRSASNLDATSNRPEPAGATRPSKVGHAKNRRGRASSSRLIGESDETRHRSESNSTVTRHCQRRRLDSATDTRHRGAAAVGSDPLR
jgi:hypothetical protein